MRETTQERNRGHTQIALDLLARALARTFRDTYGPQWSGAVVDPPPRLAGNAQAPRDATLDLARLLSIALMPPAISDLGWSPEARNLLHEARAIRNRHAHSDANAPDPMNADAYRALDTVTRLLDVLSAPEAGRAGALRQEVLIALCHEERGKLAGKKKEVVAFLNQRVFEPVLNAPATPADVSGRVRRTLETIERMPSARDIVDFYWTAIEHPTDLPKRMKELDLARFEEVMEEFRERFTDRWLWSA